MTGRFGGQYLTTKSTTVRDACLLMPNADLLTDMDQIDIMNVIGLC